MEKIEINKFFDQFEVKRNPVEFYSPYENRMLDMTDEVLDHLELLDEHTIWTLSDESKVFELIPGLRNRNVIGYFICKKKWEDANKTYQIL